MRLPALLAIVVIASPAVAQGTPDPAPPTTRDADALSKARAIGTKTRKVQKFYEPQFDLSGLPEYRPSAPMKGTLRQWGNNYIKDSGLSDVWEAGFRKHHPEVRFENNLYSSAVGFPGLIANVADLAPMGRQALWDELKGFEREGAGGGDDGSSTTEIVEIIMATGSYNVRGWTYALGAFVHKDNPLNALSIEQLDGIFGAPRDGGWDGLTWRTDWARGPEKNIRTWGQLGLKGEWADKPITVYGYNAKYHFQDEIDKKVLRGSSKWNENMHAFSNVAGLKPDGSLTAGGELITNALAGDKYGIAYTGIPFANPSVKMVALSQNGGQPVPMTLKTVQDRTYPLIRDVYYYLKKQRGKPIDPLKREFLRYVLSREGQAAVQADGKYLPLTAQAAREQLAKLDAI
ncbi:phosphate transport system substrate-binding protein [Novosphingobium kunmingense]|uniref:Phosphate transport system substrate-binding protein n=1 Tax=Novosphingobium kunmingense TaxID=1211806 RepID=A0A2N0HJB4_9SPHN|nr:substrate-binding domain-containing protein [Novosphingobium kunmingense]PKB19030.1 phosphate transport system substrate-binding protein [Novosphingobium kunmingense]